MRLRPARSARPAHPGYGRRVVRGVRGGVRGAERLDRLEEAATGRLLLGTVDAGLLAVRSARRVVEVRVTGLAAEMTYYALISLLPLLTATGAALGFLERFVGAERVQRVEDGLVQGLGRVFDPEVTRDVLAPLVRGLLEQERTGVAVGSVLVALWLASRMFRAAIRALDDAYSVPERRSLVLQVVLGLGFALGAVVTLVVVLAMVVVGPLLGGGAALAERWGTGEAYLAAWSVGRWALVGGVSTAFLTLLYRYGPALDHTWRRCLPGALLGTVGLVLVAWAFATYLDVVGSSGPDVAQATAAVRAAAQAVGAVLAGVLWLWLSSIVILAGGVVNAELERLPGRPAPAGAGGHYGGAEHPSAGGDA